MLGIFFFCDAGDYVIVDPINAFTCNCSKRHRSTPSSQILAYIQSLNLEKAMNRQTGRKHSL
jgi:hypothetical protein